MRVVRLRRGCDRSDRLRTRLAAQTHYQRRKRIRHVLFKKTQRFAGFRRHVAGQRQRHRHGLRALDDREGPAFFPQRASALGAAEVKQIVRPGVAEARREQPGFGQRRMDAALRFAERVARLARADHEIAQRTEQEACAARIALHHGNGRQRAFDQRAVQPGVDRGVQRSCVAGQEPGLGIVDQHDLRVLTLLQMRKRLQKLFDDQRGRRAL